MGDEAICTLKQGKSTFSGKAHLDANALTFRGVEKRLVIPIASMKSVSAESGELKIKCAEGSVSFTLGAQADRWANKILHPKSRLDKLGVKRESKVCVLDLFDGEFRTELRERLAAFDDHAQATDYDLIFLGVTEPADLKALGSLTRKIKPNGGLWVIRPKGGTLSDGEVMAAAKEIGLVAVKVVSFSATLSADKLVIPVSRRKDRVENQL